MQLRTALLALLMTVSETLLAQQPLANEDIVKLVKAGLSEELITSTIASKAGKYDTSADGLIALKAAGVSDKEIAAMEVKGSDAPVAGNPSPTQEPNPNAPESPHEAGIYAAVGDPAHPQMSMLEPSIYGQGKVGGVFTSGITYGIAKAKVKAVIRSAHSNVRVSDPNAVFYFYFEKQGAGLSNASSLFGGTSTPNEYTLLRFDVKKDTRETTIGKFNAYGSSGGTDNKATVQFTYVKLAPGIYKVTLSSPLSKGEYGFVSPMGQIVAGPYSAGAAGSSRVFDFGVD